MFEVKKRLSHNCHDYPLIKKKKVFIKNFNNERLFGKIGVLR